MPQVNYNCPRCDRPFPNLANLFQHFRLTTVGHDITERYVVIDREKGYVVLANDVPGLKVKQIEKLATEQRAEAPEIPA